MLEPKDKKKKKDTDFTDELGGGGEGLTKKGFLEALDKVIMTKRPKTQRISPNEGKSL